MKKILITGATGFVGKVFLKRIMAENSYQPEIVVRHFIEQYQGISQIVIPDLAEKTDWSTILTDTEIIIHIAGRAHVLKERAVDPLQAFRNVNVNATVNLAKQALMHGVKRFIFISSIGVNGHTNERPFTELDKPNPMTDYARSKWEAEQALFALTKDTTMELVIIRPPLVYGENVKANFQSLIKWVARGIPLPLGLVNNKRSFVNVDNLVDLILTTMEHPKAANQLFLVADGEDVSTPLLLKKVAGLMNKSIYLLPIPVVILKLIATLVGKKNMAVQLCDSLQVDITKARQMLNWVPCSSLDEGLSKTVTAFIKDNE